MSRSAGQHPRAAKMDAYLDDEVAPGPASSGIADRPALHRSLKLARDLFVGLGHPQERGLGFGNPHVFGSHADFFGTGQQPGDSVR